MNIVFVVYYFPPVNSTGAKRVEALSKYFAAAGHKVTVVTSRKSNRDGELTEQVPQGVELMEVDRLGRLGRSRNAGSVFVPRYSRKASFLRRAKDAILGMCGQLPDPRLPFSFAILSPWLAPQVKARFEAADVVIGSSPPWPMLLAALFAKWRFGKKCVLDYRDHFSECHAMPGSRLAKQLEKVIDRKLVAGADQVVVISPPMGTYYERLGNVPVATILNGFDHALLAEARSRALPSVDNQVLICHIGTISPWSIPHNLLAALLEFKVRDPANFARLRFECYGNASLLECELQGPYLAIAEAFKFFSALPYRDVLCRMVESDYLLFSEISLAKTLSEAGVLPTKMYEYIGSGRPVLADISTSTLAGKLLLKHGNGAIVADQAEVFLAALSDPAFFRRKADLQTLENHPLSRAMQASEYVQLLSDVVGAGQGAGRERPWRGQG